MTLKAPLQLASRHNIMTAFLLMAFQLLPNISCYATKNRWDDYKSKWNLFMKYAYEGDTLKIDSLISHGEDLNSRNVDGWDALKVAVKNGQLKTVGFLLRRKANPNLADNEGMTSLMEACLHNYFDIAKMLLESGANPNLMNEVGWTALMGATSFGDIKIMELLLKHKADINAKRRTDDMNALDFAKRRNDIAKIKLLTNYGAK